MNGHARFSPSSSERWLSCPGSVPLVENLEKRGEIPPDEGSVYSREGTAAHWLLNWCLVRDKDVDQFKREKAKGFPVRQFAGAVQDAIDYVQARKNRIPGEFAEYYERRLSIPAIKDSGTADIILHTDDELHVMDYKNGSGVPVYAKHNTQMGLYATGFPDWKSFDKVVLHIIQPNTDHKIDKWLAPRSWLNELEVKAKAAIQNAKSKTPTLKPSKAACQWCRAKAYCPALAKHVVQSAKQDWQTISKPQKKEKAIPSLNGISLAEAAAIHSNAKLIYDFLDAIFQRLLDVAIRQGKRVPGYKIVQGRVSRVWRDEARIRAALSKLKLSSNQFEPRVLLGLGAMEKLLRAEVGFNQAGVDDWMSKHTLSQKGPPTLVAESDSRPAYAPSDARKDWA